jgi:amino acid adenylation domain-containing protein
MSVAHHPRPPVPQVAPPLLDLPTDHPRPASSTGTVLAETARFSSLTPIEDALGTEPTATTLAAFVAVLARYTGAGSVPVALVSPNGERTVVLTVDDDPPFPVLGQRVAQALDGGGSTTSAERQLLFAAGLDDDGVLSPPFDLGLVANERASGIEATLLANADLFERETLRRLLSHMSTVASAAVREPDTPVSDLPFLSVAESEMLLSTWNDTAAEYPGMCVHDLVAERAAQTPDAVAVASDEGSLTYAELERRSGLFAAHLRALGVSREAIVGIAMERKPELLVALLGIMKAGGTYLPLDPAFPVDRLAFMIQDSGCGVVVTEEALSEELPLGGRTLVLIDRDWPEIERESTRVASLPESVSPDQLAYCIYTSGSTGRPKGVDISHGALVNLLWSVRERPGFGKDDVLLAVTTLSFDIAGLELYLPLVCGGRLWICSARAAQDPKALAALIERSKATVMQATPTTWRMLRDWGWQPPRPLRCLCGGEALPPSLAEDLASLNVELWNMYGPTETTIWSTCGPVVAGEAVTLGKPLANTTLYVLDERRQLRPIGVPGELYIGGHGVARGYRNRAELTAERFVDDPFREGERIYATGDLVRYRADGELEYLGRLDHQVKVRGFRIELGEIESVLATHPAVAACVCVAREDTPGEPSLAAYVVYERETPTFRELRMYLAEHLPAYMVPSAIVSLTSLPTTPNGKIDRKALPEPSRERDESAEGYRPAQTPLEERLVTIWEEVLDISPIGVDDDFFELGATSIVAARLFARIEEEFGRSLPLAPVFQAPTISALSRLIDGEADDQPAWTSLVPIQPQGTKPPIFCVHGGAGTVLHLQPLAKRLGPDQPFYGLQAQGLYGDEPPLLHVADMADHYLGELRQVQPTGPYVLAGYCFGAIVAFEMARLLIDEGEEVPIVLMFNGPSPSYIKMHGPARTPKQREEAAARAPRVRLSKRQRLLRLVVEPRRVVSYASWRAQRTKHLVDRARFRYRMRRPVALPEHLRDNYFLLISFWAELEYEPVPFPGRLVMFWGSGLYVEPNLGWSGLAAEGITSYEVPGIHEDNRATMREPHVAFIAERMERSLAELWAPPVSNVAGGVR